MLGLVAFVAMGSAPAHAQLSQGGTPPSLDATSGLPQKGVPVVVMPSVDVSALMAEDAANVGKAIPWRFGANLPVDIGPSSHGRWDTLKNGDRVWRIAIRSPGAYTINLTFDQYNLPPGAQLFVHSATTGHLIGAFTEANNQAAGSFATTLVRGDEIVIEYVEPAAPSFPGVLHLEMVTHAYRDAYQYADKAFGSSGSCNNNVVCPLSAGWENQIDSVVMLVSGGNGFCTGAMVNNTAQDGTPYLLTANHCYSNPANWVFWFNWQSNTCANPPQAPVADAMSGAVLRARRSNSDFCLVELNDPVPNVYNPYFAGWDYTGTVTSETRGIHHPSGDIKKFSSDFDPPSLTGYGGGGGNDHWEVADWDEGTTEPGSSGSPLFDDRQRIIGQLHGGSAACGNNSPDYYGAFSVSWDGANASQRLRDWLDPAGIDPGALDGTGPSTEALDAGIVSINTPADGSQTCDLVHTPEVVLRNLGSDTLTSVTIEYALNGGAPSGVPWTGSLVTGATATITLPAVTAMPGNNTLDVATTMPNGGIDAVPGNDGRSTSFEVVDPGGQSVPVPVSDDFENPVFPSPGWFNDNPDGFAFWERSTAASGFGNGAASAYFNNFDANAVGQRDSLMTPFVDLPAGTYTVQFDVAYSEYSATLSDGMAVAVSDGCGQPWTDIWMKQGPQLSTTGMYITSRFTPNPNQWRTETIDLSPYSGQGPLRIAFVNINGYGNNLYVDNIQITGMVANDPDADGDGVTVGQGDCDDDDASRYPGNPEVCDGVDNDCDGVLPADEEDADNDGIPDCLQVCTDADADGYCAEIDDCDDGDATSYPGNAEVCDGADNDCDGVLPADEEDTDGDGLPDCLATCTDTDGDGACDDMDNCPDDANPDQADTDGDGIGDACDTDVPGDGESAGGCCSSANETPASMAGSIALAAFVALLLVRRRRRDTGIATA